MVKRKPISVTGRFNNRLVNPFPDMIGDTYSYQALLNKIEGIRNAAHQKALSNYNSDMFKNPIIEVPDAAFVSNPQIPKNIKVVKSPIKSSLVPVKSYINKQQDFTNDMYDAYYKAVRPGAQSDSDADRQARFLTQKAALETGYGTNTSNIHNYGGHKTKNGWLSFKSMDDFAERDVKLLDKKWSGWRNAKDGSAFIDSINTNNGYGQYAPPNENTDYKGRYLGTTNRVNKYISMRKRSLRCGGSLERPKAWIGAVIGAGTSILGSILNANAQKRQQEELRRQQEHKAAIERAEGLTQALGLTQAAQKEYEDRFRIAYSCGGRKKLRNGVRITDGGYAIPIGHNTSLLRGGKHEDVNETGQTGIGMKVGGKVVEAEDGEVVQKLPNEVRIFSDSIGIDGYSFAELARMGYNKDKLFKIQQNMNGDYGINSKRRLRNGGSVSRPVERIAYEPGGVVQYSNGMYQKKVKYPNSNRYYWQQISESEYNKLKKQGYTVNKTPQSANPPRQVGDAQREVAEYKKNNVRKSNVVNTGAYKRAIGDGLKTKSSSYFDNSKYLKGNSTAGKSVVNTTTGNKSKNSTTPVNTVFASNNGTKDYEGRTLPEIVVTGNSNKGITYDPSKRRNNLAKSYNLSSPFTNGVSLNGILDMQEAVDRQRKLKDVPGIVDTDVTVTPSKPNNTNSSSNNTGNSTATSYNDAYNPGYTPEQELEYIRGNIGKNNTPVNSNNNQSSGSATSPENMYLGGYTPQQMEEIMKSSNTGKSNDGIDGNPPVNKFGTVFKGVDWASLAADAIGSIGSALINYNAASNIQDPVAPVRVSPGKLITNYNIAPRLAEASMMRGRMLRDSDEAVSSAARLNRRNAINMYTNNYMDKLYGEKTNREIELLNADTLNQQQVNAQNVAAYNDYMNRLIASRNNRTKAKAAAIQGGISGLGDTIGNFFDQGKERYSGQQAMLYYSALLPEEGRRYLRRSGIDFLRRGGKIY